MAPRAPNGTPTSGGCARAGAAEEGSTILVKIGSIQNSKKALINSVNENTKSKGFSLRSEKDFNGHPNVRAGEATR